MSDAITMNEVFMIFDKSISEVRFLASADSAEWLGVVTYLVHRNNQEAAA